MNRAIARQGTVMKVSVFYTQNPFEVVRLVFMPRDGERDLSLAEKTELFFHDYSIGPLFVQENYLNVRPLGAQ